MGNHGKLFEVRIKYDGVPLVDKQFRTMQQLDLELSRLHEKMGR